MTSLYIKQHNKTGLKYFGKTDETDPVAYPGSGTYWKKHLEIHGNDVTTLWHQKFNNDKELHEFAVNFSQKNNIVEARDENGKKIWANLVVENGIDGFPKGGKMPPRTEEHLKNWSKNKKGWIPSSKTRQLWSKQRTGRVVSEKTKKLHSLQTTGSKNHNALEWQIQYPTGKVIVVKGLRAFCRENNLSFNDIYNSKNGWNAIKFGKGKGGGRHKNA